MNFLAETMISGDWALKLVGAVFTGAALIAGRYWGRREVSNKITLPEPLPEITTRKISAPPSWDAHRALVDRMTRQEQISNELRHDLSEVRKDMAGQYRELMLAGQQRESSLADKLDGVARGIHHRIDEVLKTISQP